MLEQLKSEDEIINEWEQNVNNPVVSICCTTFNHEEYIEQTLKGFMMQKTRYSFEVLIHDDASSDSTAEIIRKYEKNYPNIIKSIYQQENQYSQGVKPNPTYNYPRAKGQFIALCEGDDYWIDNYKLQKQIDFLLNNKKFIATSHKFNIVDENDCISDKELSFYNIQSKVFKLSDIEDFKLPGQTATLVYRNIWHELDDVIIKMYNTYQANGDRKLALLLTLLGDIYIFDDVMSNYRVVESKGTSWTARTAGKNMSFHRYNTLLELEEFANLAFNTNLNLKSERLRTIYMSFATFIKDPSKTNYGILRGIFKLNKDSVMHIVGFLLVKFTIYPFRKVIELIGK